MNFSQFNFWGLHSRCYLLLLCTINPFIFHSSVWECIVISKFKNLPCVKLTHYTQTRTHQTPLSEHTRERIACDKTRRINAFLLLIKLKHCKFCTLQQIFLFKYFVVIAANRKYAMTNGEMDFEAVIVMRLPISYEPTLSTNALFVCWLNIAVIPVSLVIIIISNIPSFRFCLFLLHEETNIKTNSNELSM